MTNQDIEEPKNLEKITPERKSKPRATASIWDLSVTSPW